MSKLDNSNASCCSVLGSYSGQVSALAWHPLDHVVAVASSEPHSKVATSIQQLQLLCNIG